MKAWQRVSAHPKVLLCCAFGCLSLQRLRSLVAFWQSRDNGAGSQEHCCHGASHDAGLKVLIFFQGLIIILMI